MSSLGLILNSYLSEGEEGDECQVTDGVVAVAPGGEVEVEAGLPSVSGGNDEDDQINVMDHSSDAMLKEGDGRSRPVGAAEAPKGHYHCARSYKPESKLGRGLPKVHTGKGGDDEPVPVAKLPKTRPCLIRLTRCDDIAENASVFVPSTPSPPAPPSESGPSPLPGPDISSSPSSNLTLAPPKTDLDLSKTSAESSTPTPSPKPVPLDSGPSSAPLPDLDMDVDHNPSTNLTVAVKSEYVLLKRMHLRSDSKAKPSPPSLNELAPPDSEGAEADLEPPLLSLPTPISYSRVASAGSSPPTPSPQGPKSGPSPSSKKKRRPRAKPSTSESRFWDPKLPELMSGPSETIALQVKGDPSSPNQGRITVEIRKDLLAQFLL